MRKRGAGLGSPEANFMFGGPYNEQVHQTPDGNIAPYDRPTAAVDHVIDSDNRVPAAEIIPKRDKAVTQIDQAIPEAKQIEIERAEVAKKLNELSHRPDIDLQG
jgi:hypothetical protein